MPSTMDGNHYKFPKYLSEIFLNRNIPFIDSKWRSFGLQPQDKDKQLFMKHMEYEAKKLVR